MTFDHVDCVRLSIKKKGGHSSFPFPPFIYPEDIVPCFPIHILAGTPLLEGLPKLALAVEH